MTTHQTPAGLLARHAPTAPEDDLAPLLARVRHHHERAAYPPRRTAVRVVVAAGSVAAVAVAAVLAPAVLRSPAGTASALDRLALAAAAAPEAEVPSGAFLHMVKVENPGPASEYVSDHLHEGMYPRTLESWTAEDGRTWRQDTTADGQREQHVFDAHTGRGGDLGTSPQDLADLPTDPQELLDHLRPEVEGSTSNDEAVFAHLQEALLTGGGPPESRRAMIEAMALLPHIETERRLAYDGTPCVDVRYAEPLRPGIVQGMCFDEATASVVEDRVLVEGDLEYRALVTERDVVTEVPAEVLQALQDAPEAPPHG